MGIYYEVLTCLYSFSKEVTNIIFKRRKNGFLINLMAVPLTTLLLFCGILLLLPWVAFKSILSVFLKCCYWNSFGGLLGMDSVMEFEKLIITDVFILEHNGSCEDLFISVTNACQRLHNSHFKFSSVVKNICGFYYFIKNQIILDDVVALIDDDCSTRSRLLQYLENNLNDFDSKEKLWDVKVFTKPIFWKDSDKIYYPVLLRYNHCIADAICLSVFQQKYLFDEVANEGFMNAVSKSKRSKEVLKQSTTLRLGLDALKLDSSYLRLNDRSHLAIHIEDEPRYFEMVKMLSRHFKCTFTDILMLSGVFAILDYLKSRKVNPKAILTGNTCRCITENIAGVLNEEIFSNNLTLDLFYLLCDDDGGFYLAFNRMLKVLKEGRSKGNFQIFFIFRKLLTYFPSFMMKYTFPLVSSKISFAVSNIPGLDFAKLGNKVIRDFFIFLNHTAGSKFVLMIRTYGGRLQLSLASDEGVVATKEDLELILNAILKNIDKLWEMHDDVV